MRKCLAVSLLILLCAQNAGAVVALVTQAAASGSTSCTLTIPAPTTSDLIVVAVMTGASAAPTATGAGGTPFTPIPNGESPTTGAGYSITLLYRIATGAEGTTITVSNGLTAIGCVLSSWNGENTAAPFDPTAGNPQFAVGTVSPASVTGFATNSSGDAVLNFAGSINASSATFSTPTGFSNPISTTISTAGGLYGFSEIQSAAGAIGTVSSTITGTSPRWAMALLAIQPTSGPAPAPTPTVLACATPVAPPPPPGAPPPPPLNAPVQVFQPGAVFGGHTVANNADDTAAMAAALSAGDVQVNTGTYLMTTSGAGGIHIPSGRNIRCGAGTAPDATVILKYTADNANYAMFNMNGTANASVFGCTFSGPFFNNNNPIKSNFAEEFIRAEGTSANTHDNHIANNDFNGVGGFVGAIVLYANDAEQPPVNRTTIEWNTAEHCGHYFLQITSATNSTISHNTLSDCNCCVEADDTGQQNTGNVIDHSSSSFPFGTGYFHTAGSGLDSNYITGGASASGNPYNYSGNTVSNSSCTGPTLSSIFKSSAGGQAVYTNDTNTNNCQIH